MQDHMSVAGTTLIPIKFDIDGLDEDHESKRIKCGNKKAMVPHELTVCRKCQSTYNKANA